jgi:Zn-dependent protease with chaperone function
MNREELEGVTSHEMSHMKNHDIRLLLVVSTLIGLAALLTAGLISALKKLQQNDKPFKKMNHATAAMCIDNPLQHQESWYHRLYDTHPPIAQRIAEFEKIAVGQSV